MHIAGHPYNVLTETEIHRIHRGALRILAEMGMEIQNQDLLQPLAEAGCQVDFDAERVRFPIPLVERYIAEAPKYDWAQHKPRVNGSAGLYHCFFHDPQTGDLLPWTEERVAYYFKLARVLPNISHVSYLGSRLPCPPELVALYERLHAWQWGTHEGGSIYEDGICPYLLELYELRAEMLGKPIQQVFEAGVFLVPVMKLARHEAFQVAWFKERGLRVDIGDMFAIGATSPASIAGSVTLNLAERLAFHIINRVWFGDTHLSLSSSLMPMDPQTMVHAFGRPEMAIANVVGAQLARFYGIPFWGHAGLTDAKFPSTEVGAQKAYTAAITLLAGGNFGMDAGLLAMDEIVSPIQLVLDNEFLNALKPFTQSFDFSEEALGLDTILAVGPGGNYLDQVHSARYYRKEHWMPQLWTRTMLTPWQDAGAKLDVDRAREFALEVWDSGPDDPFMTDDQEKAVLEVIGRAKKALNC